MVDRDRPWFQFVGFFEFVEFIEFLEFFGLVGCGATDAVGEEPRRYRRQDGRLGSHMGPELEVGSNGT